MANVSIRFENGVVFRICMQCKKILGCYFFGLKNECLACYKNCFFRKTKISIEGYQLLEKNDSSTTSMCEACFFIQRKLIFQEELARLNNIPCQ